MFRHPSNRRTLTTPSRLMGPRALGACKVQSRSQFLTSMESLALLGEESYEEGGMLSTEGRGEAWWRDSSNSSRGKTDVYVCRRLTESVQRQVYHSLTFQGWFSREVSRHWVCLRHPHRGQQVPGREAPQRESCLHKNLSVTPLSKSTDIHYPCSSIKFWHLQKVPRPVSPALTPAGERSVFLVWQLRPSVAATFYFQGTFQNVPRLVHWALIIPCTQNHLCPPCITVMGTNT